MNYGYIRISTEEQNTENQKRAIAEKYTIDKPHYFKLTPYREEIRRRIAQGESIYSMARAYGVRWNTMRNFCKVNIYIDPLPPLTSAPRKHGHPTRRELEYFRNH